MVLFVTSTLSVVEGWISRRADTYIWSLGVMMVILIFIGNIMRVWDSSAVYLPSPLYCSLVTVISVTHPLSRESIATIRFLGERSLTGLLCSAVKLNFKVVKVWVGF